MKTSRRHNNFSASLHNNPLLPSMIVFDLDDCLWTPEMHELPGMPSIPAQGKLSNGEQGVVGVKVPRSDTTVTLYPGARQALHELATDPKYEGIVLATASSSLEPSYSRACLRIIEILPGVTLNDMFRHNAIGRSGRLTPNKTTHFQLLHEESGIDYEEMLFFDGMYIAKYMDSSFVCEISSRETSLSDDDDLLFVRLQLGRPLPSRQQCLWSGRSANT